MRFETGILLVLILAVWVGTVGLFKNWHQETVKYQKQLIVIHNERNEMIKKGFNREPRNNMGTNDCCRHCN